MKQFSRLNMVGLTVVALASLSGLAVAQSSHPAPAAQPTDHADKMAKPAAKPANEIKVGDTLPQLTFKDADGKDVDAKTLYAKGPAVIMFYRGNWCPYCNKSLKAFQDKVGEAKEMGATIAAVSPEKSEELKETAKKDSLTYTLLSDSTGEGMKKLGLGFNLDDATKTKYKGFGVDLAKHNASGEWALPHPATLVVDTKGVVRYAYVNEDYTKRAEPEEVLAAVKKLTAEHGTEAPMKKDAK
ncbi:MAG: peroxiredoxin-like family protein [Phycisphaerales bacterium]|jgi:peroxiredoxin